MNGPWCVDPEPPARGGELYAELGHHGRPRPARLPM